MAVALWLWACGVGRGLWYAQVQALAGLICAVRGLCDSVRSRDLSLALVLSVSCIRYRYARVVCAASCLSSVQRASQVTATGAQVSQTVTVTGRKRSYMPRRPIHTARATSKQQATTQPQPPRPRATSHHCSKMPPTPNAPCSHYYSPFAISLDAQRSTIHIGGPGPTPTLTYTLQAARLHKLPASGDAMTMVMGGMPMAMEAGHNHIPAHYGNFTYEQRLRVHSSTGVME